MIPEQIEGIVAGPEFLDTYLAENKHEFTITISKFLLWALENNRDSFIFADIHILPPDSDEAQILKLGCKRSDYLEALQKQIKNLIEFEEYEMCPPLQEWVDYLEIEEKVKK